MNIFYSYPIYVDYLALHILSKPDPGREEQRTWERRILNGCFLHCPHAGLPHHDARFGDGDQWLPLSHWSNGGTIYIPGTAQRSL